MVGNLTLNDTMSDDKEDYNESHPKTISSRLNRVSIERIKKLGKHWDECYGEP